MSLGVTQGRAAKTKTEDYSQSVSAETCASAATKICKMDWGNADKNGSKAKQCTKDMLKRSKIYKQCLQDDAMDDDAGRISPDEMLKNYQDSINAANASEGGKRWPGRSSRRRRRKSRKKSRKRKSKKKKKRRRRKRTKKRRRKRRR